MPGKMNTPVDPAHYRTHPSGVDCITITEHMNFCLGNAVKYIWRAGQKGDEVEDLKKARWYVDREIARLEEAREDLKGKFDEYASKWQEPESAAPVAPATPRFQIGQKVLVTLVDGVEEGEVLDYVPIAKMPYRVKCHYITSWYDEKRLSPVLATAPAVAAKPATPTPAPQAELKVGDRVLVTSPEGSGLDKTPGTITDILAEGTYRYVVKFDLYAGEFQRTGWFLRKELELAK